MLTKEVVIDKIEIGEDGSLSVRRATYILEDGVRVGLLGYHRVAYTKEQDITTEHATVRAVAAAVKDVSAVSTVKDARAARRR